MELSFPYIVYSKTVFESLPITQYVSVRQLLLSIAIDYCQYWGRNYNYARMNFIDVHLMVISCMLNRANLKCLTIDLNLSHYSTYYNKHTFKFDYRISQLYYKIKIQRTFSRYRCRLSWTTNDWRSQSRYRHSYLAATKSRRHYQSNQTAWDFTELHHLGKAWQNPMNGMTLW